MKQLSNRQFGSIEQVAHRAQRSSRTIQRWLRAGRLTPNRIDGWDWDVIAFSEAESEAAKSTRRRGFEKGR
jgi:hypothetical protein